MTTTTKDATVSVRLTAREKINLDADARMKGIPTGTAAAAYISEGVRRSRFPAIEFRDGQPGRVAYLVGTRWPVWLIVALLEELKGDIHAAATRIRKPAALTQMALAYADAYPQEIADCTALAAQRDFAGLKQEIPNLEQL
jgi:hypothetical protein